MSSLFAVPELLLFVKDVGNTQNVIEIRLDYSDEVSVFLCGFTHTTTVPVEYN